MTDPTLRERIAKNLQRRRDDLSDVLEIVASVRDEIDAVLCSELLDPTPAASPPSAGEQPAPSAEQYWKLRSQGAERENAALRGAEVEKIVKWIDGHCAVIVDAPVHSHVFVRLPTAPPAAAGEELPTARWEVGPLGYQSHAAPAPEAARVERWAVALTTGALVSNDCVEVWWDSKAEAEAFVGATDSLRVVRLVEMHEGDWITNSKEMDDSWTALRQRAEAAERQVISGVYDAASVGVTLIDTDKLDDLRAQLAALTAGGVEGVVKEWATGLGGTRHYHIETHAASLGWDLGIRVRVIPVLPPKEPRQ